MSTRYGVPSLDLTSVNDRMGRIQADMKLPRLKKSQLQSDGGLRGEAVVTDATPNPRLAYFDGTTWRYSSDDSVVS